jgi:imidazolonepropionase
MKKLIGPFIQILPLTGMPQKGALKDEQLHIIPNGGVLVEDGLILAVGDFEELGKQNPSVEIEEVKGTQVLLPGFIDCHTHICFGGNRAKDYAMRIQRVGPIWRLPKAAAGSGIRLPKPDWQLRKN